MVTVQEAQVKQQKKQADSESEKEKQHTKKKTTEDKHKVLAAITQAKHLSITAPNSFHVEWNCISPPLPVLLCCYSSNSWLDDDICFYTTPCCAEERWLYG